MVKYNLDDYAKCARCAAAEGIVLLQNEGNVLPLIGKHNIALFGRTQFNYYKSGTGSGGLVNTRYVTGIYEAFSEDEDFTINAELRGVYEEWVKEHPFDMGQGWAQEPWFQEEMPLAQELVENAARTSDTAVIIVGRTAGEDKDNKAEAGSYLLTDVEMDMLRKVCKTFERTVVILNVGNIIDMKWVDEVKPSAVLYTWQGGQEGGNGVLDVMKGTVSPSGKLADTIAYDAEDYFSTKYHGDDVRNIYVEDIYVGYRYFETFAKDKVLYPFGFGLSYTTFEVEGQGVEAVGDRIQFTAKVTNTGSYKGKEVVMVYAEAPQGVLGKAARSLCAFTKTVELAPGEDEVVILSCSKYDLASYDDAGLTGQRSAYVLEAGDYHFYLGGDVRSAVEMGQITVAELTVVKQLEEVMAPVQSYERIRPVSTESGYAVGYEQVPVRSVLANDRRVERMPSEIPYTGDKGYKLSDVKDGNIALEEFIAQFTDEELMAVVRGEGMSPGGVTPGIAGAFGGVSKRLKDLGMPKAGCADGPSGIRMDCGSKAFAMPNGTCLACTFNQELSEELYEYEGLELRKNKIDTLLGPGMNIHRNPLNGRNFEYFSEDPLVTGKMAAAQLKGMYKYGVTGTVKHYACNNQEHKRAVVDSVVSERALREIYLRGYEIAVREGGAFLIMTSYNRINNMHAASNYDLNTTVLRGEWGFDGTVMTDWWAQGNEEDGASVLKHTAVMVAAQNDLFMVMPDAGEATASDTTKEGLEKGLVTRAELQRTVANVCRTLMRLPAYNRFYGVETELDKELAAIKTEDVEGLAEMQVITESDEPGVYVIDSIDTTKGKNNFYQVECGGGVFRIVMECSASGGNKLAQIPVSVFKEFSLIKTITLTGEDTEKRTEIIELSQSLTSTLFLRFYFGQGGMNIHSLRVERTMTQEELMEQMRKWRESGTAF